MLRLEGVRSGYGRTEILHGVDLVVPQGSTVAVLGANGAGKTTLLKTIAGLLRTSAGRVVFDGRPLGHEKGYRRSRQGMCLIPEGRGIFRQLSVRENLAMYVGGRDVDRAIEIASGFFPVLGERLDQAAGTLSGGQQQMVAVARALVTEPKLVLADELSVGLAPVVIDEIYTAIQAMREAGRSVLLVEQYVDRALEVADYVYVLHKGRVVFVGEPEQCHEHATLFERFLGSVA